MTRLATRKPRDTTLVKQILRKKFPNVRAYRYSEASIRIRIIDPRFAGRNLVERERMVQPLIRELPEEVQSDIMVLLTLAPGEENKSMMNYEFEHPSRSGI